jgi:hypothetical protein
MDLKKKVEDHFAKWRGTNYFGTHRQIRLVSRLGLSSALVGADSGVMEVRAGAWSRPLSPARSTILSCGRPFTSLRRLFTSLRRL